MGGYKWEITWGKTNGARNVEGGKKHVSEVSTASDNVAAWLSRQAREAKVKLPFWVLFDVIFTPLLTFAGTSGPHLLVLCAFLIPANFL